MEAIDLAKINASAFGELQKSPEIEVLSSPIINNTETIKRIEDKRNFVTSERQRSSGLIIDVDSNNVKCQAPTSSRSNPQSSVSSGSTPYYSNYGYPYGNVQKPPETETKAKNFSKDVFSSAKEEYSSRKRGEDKIWTILDLQDKAIEKKNAPHKSRKQKIEDRKKDSVTMSIYKICMSFGKMMMESAYMNMKRRTKGK